PRGLRKSGSNKIFPNGTVGAVRCRECGAKVRGGFPMPIMQSRRRFLAMLSLAGVTGLVRAPRALAAEAALETTAVRILKFPAICVAPQYVADELLRAEGFTEIAYVDAGRSVDFSAKVGRGEADFTLAFAAQT